MNLLGLVEILPNSTSKSYDTLISPRQSQRQRYLRPGYWERDCVQSDVLRFASDSMSFSRQTVFLALLATLALFAVVSLFGDSRSGLFHSKSHPLHSLIKKARNDWENLERRQSKTLKAATKEYHRRYHREPPQGFESWFQFCQDNFVSIVDDYDGLERDLEPFWSLDPEEIKHRAWLLSPAARSSLEKIYVVQISGGEINFAPERINYNPVWDRRAELFAETIKRLPYTFPDMLLPINEDAPPRVIVSEAKLNEDRHIKRPKFFMHDSKGMMRHIRAACSEFSPINTKTSIGAGEHVYDTRFVADIREEMDVCYNSDIQHVHSGLRQRWWSTLDELYPLFSYGTTTAHKDIKIPAEFFYFHDHELPGQSQYSFKEGTDRLWHEKIPMMYWRGRTTDSVVDDLDFASQQRHRIVAMAHSTHGSLDVIGSTQNNLKKETIPILELNKELMNVWFTRAMTGNRTCSTESKHECIRAQADHPFLNEWTKYEENWDYKYLLDNDGYGYSARFRALLESGSVPIKTTIYEEWFTDRMVPWLHYVPLRNSYEGLYDVLAYFTGLKTLKSESAKDFVDHDAQAESIALAGTDFVKRHMRRVDMDAYVFRLLLEWARIISDDRDD